MTISSFYPPKRVLMGPGPSDISPRVLQALSKPTLGHLDPLFIEMMDELKELLRYAFQTENEYTLAISAPGSAGMEACFVNLIEPGDKVVVCQNGVFGSRMAENVRRCGGELVLVEDAWGEPVSLEKVAATLARHSDAAVLAFVHAETSTGVESDVAGLCQLARDYGCLTIVDTVTSLGGIPLKVDEWGIDAVYSGSQKCLSCVPGLSPVSFSEAALEKIRRRKHPVQSWFLDQSLVMDYWSGEGKRSYHHTAPVNSLYALHEALVMLQEEGLVNAWRRHEKMHQLLADGLEAMGLDFIVAKEHRLPQLNLIRIPEGVDDARVRAYLLENYQLEMGAGLGVFTGHAWRIGLMGYAANKANILLLLAALKEAL